MGQIALKTILVVDDDKDIKESIVDALSEEGYNIIHVDSEERALNCLDRERVDLVITTLNAPMIDGMRLLSIAKEKHPETDFIIVASLENIELTVQAIKAGASDLQVKPIDIEKLKISIGEALKNRLILVESIDSPHPLDSKFGLMGFVGNSEKMQKIYKTITRVAPVMATVLIVGETGTGKNLIANAIHYNSPRKDKPFVELSCAALSESVMESELFGHERGAFTSAIKQKKGRFELADGGTLFLNDVSDINPYTQVKLLRVLEDKEFERVGGMETISVNVRLIAATNKSLEQAIEENKFRQDLYYRLRGVTIEIPPLRQRKEDIPALVDAFIRQSAKLNSTKIKGITDQAMQFLIEYDWPGNVRELKNCIDGMVVMARGLTLGMNDLPKYIRRSGDDKWQVNIHVGMSARDAERELIAETLRYTNNNKALAAKILNMGLRTLFRKVKEYDIS
jgi:DNA-binding NtrC family response regulator